jgi:hypothetical protein
MRVRQEGQRFVLVFIQQFDIFFSLARLIRGIATLTGFTVNNDGDRVGGGSSSMVVSSPNN